MKKNLILIIISLILSVSCSKSDDGSIIGTASAGGGDIVSGITVKLYSEGAVFLRDTQTDNEGNFAFSGLEPANYYVAATMTVSGEIWDTGNTPRIVYVSDEIVEEVVLTLS
ncbi:MAG: carboxypeptidase-like regulatory domain-containing protein, partial [Methylococcaceae bacterium]